MSGHAEPPPGERLDRSLAKLRSAFLGFDQPSAATPSDEGIPAAGAMHAAHIGQHATEARQRPGALGRAFARFFKHWFR
jgi:hypothetical protein